MMGTNDSMDQVATTTSDYTTYVVTSSYFVNTVKSSTQEAAYQSSTLSENGSRIIPALVSDATFSTVMPILNVVSMVLGCLSIVCCTANALVYFRQRPNPSAHYLLVLNVGDGLHSACKMAYAFSAVVLPPTDKTYFIMAFYVSAAAGTCFRRTAVCMNALTSLDRFLAIAFPLRGRTHGCGRRAPLFVVTAVFCVVVLIHSYLFYEYELTPTEDYAWVPKFTQMRLQNPEAFQWARYLGRGLCFYLPLLAALCFNVALLFVLRAHEKVTQIMRRTAGGPQPARPGAERNSHASELAMGNAVSDGLYADNNTHDQRRTTTTSSSRQSLAIENTPSGHISNANGSLIQTANNATQPRQYGDARERSLRQTWKHSTVRHAEDRHDWDKASQKEPTMQKSTTGSKRVTTDKAEWDRTRLILTLTFSFFFLALPRVVVAESSHLFPEFFHIQRNVNVILIVLSDWLTFSTDAVLSLVTLFYSAHFRHMIVRVLLKKAVSLRPATGNSATAINSEFISSASKDTMT